MKVITCDRCSRDMEGMHIIFQGRLMSRRYAVETGRNRYQWERDKDIDLCNECKSELVILLSDWFTK